MYALDDRLLMVASDRISTYDAVHPTPIPDKGKVLTGLSVFWFEKTEADRRQPPDLRDRGRARRSARPGAGRAQAARCCRSSASCAATSRGRAGRTTRPRGAVSGIELPRGLRESEQLPEPIFTPSTKADVGHDETIDFEQATELVGDGALMERVRDVVDRAVLVRRRARARARRDPRRHEVRVRPRRARRAGPRRRGPDARLLALLAGRRLRGRAAGSRASTSSTCATGPPAAAGTSARPRRRSPRTSSRARARATSRRTS